MTKLRLTVNCNNIAIKDKIYLTMKIFYYILIIVILTTCKEGKKTDINSKYYKEFYSVLHELVQKKFSNVSLIVGETTPVYKNMYGKFPVPRATKEIPPPPPPPGIIYYDNNTFNSLTYSGQLDSADARFMYNSIDSTIVLKIDTSKSNLRVIPLTKLIEIFRNGAADGFEKYDEIEKLYGSKRFIIVSTPVYNSTMSKMILSVSYRYGPPDGEDYRFVLEKRNNGVWSIISNEKIWERR